MLQKGVEDLERDNNATCRGNICIRNKAKRYILKCVESVETLTFAATTSNKQLVETVSRRE